MKIEILYFDDCPNHRPAVERVHEILAEERISAPVTEVKVADLPAAQRTGFLGSPTIRVNGLDVEPAARAARDYGVMCRTYEVNGRREGLPSRDMLRKAIREAGSGGVEIKSGSTAWFAAGSILAAIVASFCCILPIVFALTGFSILGASALFDAWRPYLLGVTFGLLGLGFYFTYRPRKGQCAPGSACSMPKTNLGGRRMLWLAAAAAILLAAFPYYSGAVAGVLFR
jgi:MerT mercuric transport protein